MTSHYFKLPFFPRNLFLPRPVLGRWTLFLSHLNINTFTPCDLPPPQPNPTPKTSIFHNSVIYSWARISVRFRENGNEWVRNDIIVLREDCAQWTVILNGRNEPKNDIFDAHYSKSRRNWVKEIRAKKGGDTEGMTSWNSDSVLEYTSSHSNDLMKLIRRLRGNDPRRENSFFYGNLLCQQEKF